LCEGKKLAREPEKKRKRPASRGEKKKGTWGKTGEPVAIGVSRGKKGRAASKSPLIK